MSERSKSSRRDIITAGLARNTDSEAGKEPGGLEPDLGGDRQYSHIERYSTRAMACQFELIFNLQEYRNAGEVALKTFALIDACEEQMSVYREQSEICQINKMAFREDVDVESRLFELLELSVEVYEKTEGAFDITSGHLSETWGFSRRQGSVPSAQEIQRVLKITGSRHFRIIPETGQIRFARQGLKLNLGGIGKGFAVDMAVDLIHENNIGNFVIHAGQSSVVARGNCLTRDPNAPGAGWQVGLSHPTLPGCRLAEIRLVDAALGTSGTLRQGFFHRGKRYGHIIDPRTGVPTDHCLSSTVICKSAARADALATAFFVMNLDQVHAFCEKHQEVAAILVVPGPRADEIRIESINAGELQIKYLV